MKVKEKMRFEEKKKDPEEFEVLLKDIKDVHVNNALLTFKAECESRLEVWQYLDARLKFAST